MNVMSGTLIRWIGVCTAVLVVSVVLYGGHLFKSVKFSDIYGRNVETFDQSNKTMETPHSIIKQTTVINATDSTGYKEIVLLRKILVQLSQDVRDAKTHVRGTKARKALLSAIKRVEKLLQITKTTTEGLKRKCFPSKHKCKDVFKGTRYGHPFFNKGFETEKCPHDTPIEKLVTLVVLRQDDQVSSLMSLLEAIWKYNNKIKVVVGIPNLGTLSNLTRYNTMTFREVPHDFSYGKAWNLLLEQVVTEYSLIARNITHFDTDVRIGRLIYAIETLNVAVVGGASRDGDGLWKHGCYQSAHSNYSLFYEEGYDESLRECIFCDYVNGPFLVRKETTQIYKLDEHLKMSSVFHDFFLRLSKNKVESAVCPDSMFHINRPKPSNNAMAWTDLAAKYNLYRLKFADEFDMKFSCVKWKGKCNKATGYALHPCCIQELTDIVKFFMKLCEESGMICELHCGTLLGAVKFGKTLPWERDADIRFLTSNFTALLQHKSKIMKQFKFWDDKG